MDRHVIMPNHVHLLLVPGQNETLSLTRWVTWLKSNLTRNWTNRPEGKIWQAGFWDTQIRDEAHLESKWLYIVQNPVRAGLVTNPAEWPYQG